MAWLTFFIWYYYFATTCQSLYHISHPALQSIVIKEIRSYTGTHGELSLAIHREEASPGWFGKVSFLFYLFYFILFCPSARVSARKPARGGPALRQLFKHRSRSHRHGYEHRDLGLHIYPCARLRIWSRETVPTVPPRYRTDFIYNEVNTACSSERVIDPVPYTGSTRAPARPHASWLYPVPSMKAK